ncbi:monocarboxylate transporter 12 [Rhinichthys klamathensis goyatoka]|uniref:monocarboxylate transporter 12 n=1 Tax=Rhinichthys klamathensis goyatoka TaxID=3034132 RepID=UPI0024B5309C|nr:monocarboxylate transporter 12 [Rhinichthys klamathensis goyatoka]XP_056120259.1 monocarboxylate transporter 12 [Rhinichthys klamathensis goyatoka]XP_056120260.1 monocarboxylate transporter 12 [Rhinichthys klamathensis goyatoka]
MREKQQVNTSQTEPERTKPAETGQKRKQEAERSERVRERMKRGLEMTEKKPHSAASPDGGWGWMIVAGCFLTTVCTRAVTRCVSIFFVEFQSYFSRDYSATAWIHSLLDCTTMLCAPLGSYIGNRLSSRIAVMIGGLLSSAGLVLSSLATSVEFLYLTLGVLTGVGFALSYTPAIAMVGSYFSERKALAYGIAMSGSGIGTFILAPAVQLLIEFFSWRGALLILGGLVSHLCVCGALMRPLEGQRGRQKEMDLEGNKKVDLLNLKLDGVLDVELSAQEQRSVEVKHMDTDKMMKDRGGGEQADNMPWDGKEQMEADLWPSDAKHTHSDEELNHRQDLSENSETVNGSADEWNISVPTLIQSDDLPAIPESKPEANANHTILAQSKVLNTNILKESKENVSSIIRKPVLREYSFLLIPDFLLLLVSFLFLAYGCSVPFVYLVPYSLSAGVSPQQAALLMSILGVSGIVGTITFGWIADRKCLRPYRVVSYMLAVGSEGLSCLFLPLLSGFSLLVPFSLIYGYFDGAYVALIPVVTSDTVSSTQLTSALGVVYFLHAIPYLISPPIGGWLVDQTGSYTSTFFLSGVSLICSAVILAAVRVIIRCTRGSSCLN